MGLVAAENHAPRLRPWAAMRTRSLARRTVRPGHAVRVRLQRRRGARGGHHHCAHPALSWLPPAMSVMWRSAALTMFTPVLLQERAASTPTVTMPLRLRWLTFG